MLRGLRANEQGIVFVTVLLIIVIMMILTVSIVSLNVTQVVNTSGEAKNIQAQYLALGAIPFFYANQLSDSQGSTVTYTEMLGGTQFTVSAKFNGAGLAGYDTNGLSVNVSY